MLAPVSSKPAVQVSLWAVVCFQQLISVLLLFFIFFQVCLAHLLRSHGLLPPSPPEQPAGSYVHNVYALHNTFIVFQSNCKGHFLGSLSQYCHFSFLHNAIGSLFFTV